MNMPTQPNTMMRCMDCGRLNDANEYTCGFCGATLRSDRAAFSSPPNGNTRASDQPRLPQFPDSTMSSPFSFYGALTRPAQGQIPAQALTEDKRVASAELSGRVIAAEPVIHEKPDFDWCKFATRLLWFLLLVVSPFILLRAVLVHLGALPVIFAIFGFLFLLKFISPTNIFSLIQLNMFLNPLRRHEAEQIPVRYFRVRDSHEREWIVRMKGQIDGGNIAPDDIISAWGKWRSGALALSRAYNHRTQSFVFVRTSQSWIMLAATAGLILFIGIYFYRPFHMMWQTVHHL